MKRTLFLTFVASLFVIGGSAVAADWTIDKAHSSISFEAKHLVISTVPGKFTDFTGTVSLDPKDLSKTTANFTVQIASITTGEEQRDTHLKSADFFDAEKYPTMTFQSTKVNVIGPGKIELGGNLTMRGVTKEVTFTVEGFNTPIEFMGTTKVGGSATATINRQDFGVSWNKALDSGGVLVGDEIKIIVELELNQKQ